MRHLDLSFEGRRVADRGISDNGTRPHGGYKGSKRHPMCHLSFDKGRDFQQKFQDEFERLLFNNDLALQGTTPSWSLLVHREPSYTDESPLLTNQYLSASKTMPSNGVTLQNRPSLLPPRKTPRPQRRTNDNQFYRPNSTHQYLSATELKNASEGDVNMLYGRPTRTTLLRARQRCTSAPLNNNQTKRRDSDPRIDDFRSCCTVPSNTEHIQLDRDGETLHSFLTGARYNRAHCLDARSVDHTGVYMPRNNTAMGCFFTGPKGHEYLKEFDDMTSRSESTTASPRAPPSPKRRPTTAPGHGKRSLPPSIATPPSPPLHPRKAWTINTASKPKSRYKALNIVGCRLPLGFTKEMALKLPLLTHGQVSNSTAKKIPGTDETYRAHQPPPTPTSLHPTEPTERFSQFADNESLSKGLVGKPVTQVAVSMKNGHGERRVKVEEIEKKEEFEFEKQTEEETNILESGLINNTDDAIEETKEVEKGVDEIVKDDEEKEREKKPPSSLPGDFKMEENVVEEKEASKELDGKDNLEEERVVGEDVKENDVDDNNNIDDNDDLNINNNKDDNVDDNIVDEFENDKEENDGEKEVVGQESEQAEEKDEDDDDEDGRPIKEVRFFITEKDKEDVDGGDLGHGDGVKDEEMQIEGTGGVEKDDNYDGDLVDESERVVENIQDGDLEEKVKEDKTEDNLDLEGKFD